LAISDQTPGILAILVKKPVFDPETNTILAYAVYFNAFGMKSPDFLGKSGILIKIGSKSTRHKEYGIKRFWDPKTLENDLRMTKKEGQK